MTYSDEEIRLQLQLGEDSVWEFKAIRFTGNRPTGPSRDDWANEIVAFANAEGGTLLCGVTDDGDVQGMSREQMVELDSLLVEVSVDSIKPPVRIRTYHRQLDGKSFLLLVIPRGDSLYESHGQSYIRVGGTKQRMGSEERLRLAQRRGQARIRSFDEQPVPDTGFETLDESLWRPLLSAEGAAEPRTSLERLDLLGDDDNGTQRATVAGLLLCAQRPEEWLPGAGITATRYRGYDRASSQVDAQEITGPLNHQIRDAVAFARRNMRVSALKTPARMNLPQYSERAIFEAIVNAVVHRDYSVRGSRTRLSMFEDRLEIQSPGSLPNNLNLESMKTRQATRNEALTSVLSRMPVEGILGSDDRLYIMERRGDGVTIIHGETQELTGKPAEYRLFNDSEVLLIIPAAELEHSPARAVVSVRIDGKPLAGANVLALFPNRTYQEATTNEAGVAALDFYTTRLPMTVFVAAPRCRANVHRGWVPSQDDLEVELVPLPQGGSAIFAESVGYIPSIKGRLNPIRDHLDRTYLYASNISVNEGSQQPVHFALGDDLHLIDADGKSATVRVVEVVGRSALVEYQAAAEE